MDNRQLTEERLKTLANLPYYQMLGIFGMNPWQNQLNEMQHQDRRDQVGKAVDSASAGLDKLFAQLQKGGPTDLYNISSNLAMGKGSSMLRSAAGMSGLAGSGLQALGSSQLASSVLANLANQIAGNQLQRTQLGASLLTSKAGLQTGLYGLDLQQQQLDAKRSQDFMKTLLGIAKAIATLA